MRQWHSACFLVGRIKNKTVLQLSGDHHLGDRIIKPFSDLFDHVVDVRIDQAIKFIWSKAKPRHSLQKTIRAAVRAAASDHELPESEAHNLGVLARTSKLADEIRSSILSYHQNPGNLCCPWGQGSFERIRPFALKYDCDSGPPLKWFSRLSLRIFKRLARTMKLAASSKTTILFMFS